MTPGFMRNKKLAVAAYAAHIFVAEKVTQDLSQSQWVIFAVELVVMAVLGLAASGVAGAPIHAATMALVDTSHQPTA